MLIAQISDIHGGPGAPSLTVFERAIDQLRIIKPDAVAVSGDLASNRRENAYSIVREGLESLGVPTLIVPGNADDHEALRSAFSGRWASGRMHARLAVGEVEVIGLDVTVPGETHGDLAEDTAAWLAEALTDGQAKHILIVMHQEPFSTGIAALDAIKCRNEDRLAAVLDRHGERVTAITTGHGHRSIFTRFGRWPAMMCPAITKPNPPLLDGYGETGPGDAPGMMLHQFTPGGLISHVVTFGSV